MEKIYIVTEGCYSDYHIEAVFKDREKAEHYCSCHEECAIEEYWFSDDKRVPPFESAITCFMFAEDYLDIKLHLFPEGIAHHDVFSQMSPLIRNSEYAIIDKQKGGLKDD